MHVVHPHDCCPGSDRERDEGKAALQALVERKTEGLPNDVLARRGDEDGSSSIYELAEAAHDLKGMHRGLSEVEPGIDDDRGTLHAPGLRFASECLQVVGDLLNDVLVAWVARSPPDLPAVVHEHESGPCPRAHLHDVGVEEASDVVYQRGPRGESALGDRRSRGLDRDRNEITARGEGLDDREKASSFLGLINLRPRPGLTPPMSSRSAPSSTRRRAWSTVSWRPVRPPS